MGGEQKLTMMAIKVDLDCYKCRKKIKKVLCRIPQIQNQVYDEKANVVIITVLCCSPEKVMEKICCKGGESVKGIEIVKPPPPKPKEPEKPKEKPKEPEKPKEKPKEPAKPAGPPPATAKPAPAPAKPKENNDKPPKQTEPAPKPQPKPAPPSQTEIPIGFPPPAPGPTRTCCRECYEGWGVGPCHSMLGPPPCYDGYGRPVYDNWGGGGCRGGGYYGSRGECFSDDNTSGCVVM
ncbi:unnamed protein product [Linum tenue]|uniref:Uncharacterized protein n=1 Tax=Linum tenue TaxID=586396 RepID=A0AAV0GMT0_9ROSI|nr:unnamed protein product [Linum tenue]